MVSNLSHDPITVFISIDCGAANGHVGENNIRWVGDDQFIKTGDRQVVKSANSTVMSTPRVFSSHKKNCYTIGVERSTRVLVRAIFFLWKLRWEISQTFIRSSAGRKLLGYCHNFN